MLSTGAGGTTASAVLAEAEVDAFDRPITFVALTVKVYVVPSLKPVIVQVVLEVVQVAPVFEVAV
jgi:hypothetical protein